MIELIDPYKVLQVNPNAEPEVIRAAYDTGGRARSLVTHPLSRLAGAAKGVATNPVALPGIA